MKQRHLEYKCIFQVFFVTVMDFYECIAPKRQ